LAEASPGSTRARRRAVTTVALAIVTALGLLSRRFPLPGVFAEHVGDALYTVAAFFALALFAPAAQGAKLAWAALAASAAVEASQLLSWPWLQDLRSTRVGALLLGQGFQVADLFAYACGALGAWCVDGACARRGAVDGKFSGRFAPGPADRR
jgi:hypothetical protein